MPRTKTSKAWLMEHVNDPFVQRAKAEGYRSRAVYKLMEIDDKDRLIKKGMVVIELGAAPGSWSQIIKTRVGPAGRVIAIDLLEIVPMAGVEFIQADFSDEATLADLDQRLNGQPVGLVLSDMAPNLSGIDSADQAASLYLCELALDFAKAHLKAGGAFACKVFQGEGFEQYLKDVRAAFASVAISKPKASRARSSEVYLVAKNFRRV